MAVHFSWLQMVPGVDHHNLHVATLAASSGALILVGLYARARLGTGEKATDFASAAQIILDGGVVDYDGFSGPITFDENGDPTEATIGIYEYAADNTYSRIN